MMKKTLRNILVLAMDDGAMMMAQAHLVGGQYQVRQTATFSIAGQLSLDEPTPLGQALGSFLHQHHISAKAAVIGVPAKWVVGKPITVPPTSQENVTSILDLQAEQAFSINFQDLVFDYSGRISPTQTNQVLLVAMQRHRLEQIKAVAKAAGLQLLSITPTAAAMSVFSSASSRTSLGIYALNSHSEVVLCGEGTVREIKHVPTPLSTQDPGAMAADIQRLLLLMGRDNRTQDPMELVVWSDRSDGPETLVRLGPRLGAGIDIRPGRDAMTGTGRIRMEKTALEYDPAVSLILAQTQTDAPIIDFLHSPIGVRKTKRHTRVSVWAAVIGVSLLIGLGSVYWDYHQDCLQIAAHEKALKDNSQAFEAASSIKDKVAQASGWYTGRPRYLNCLRDLTLAFPERGDIWVTSLRLQDNSEGVIAGEALNRQGVVSVRDAMEQSGSFSKVQTLHVNDIGRDSKEVSFAISFQYRK